MESVSAENIPGFVGKLINYEEIRSLDWKLRDGDGGSIVLSQIFGAIFGQFLINYAVTFNFHGNYLHLNEKNQSMRFSAILPRNGKGTIFQQQINIQCGNYLIQ